MVVNLSTPTCNCWNNFNTSICLTVCFLSAVCPWRWLATWMGQNLLSTQGLTQVTGYQRRTRKTKPQALPSNSRRGRGGSLFSVSLTLFICAQLKRQLSPELATPTEGTGIIDIPQWRTVTDTSGMSLWIHLRILAEQLKFCLTIRILMIQAGSLSLLWCIV